MPVNKTNNLGDIQISDKAIAILVGNAVSQCYGVVGVTSKRYRDIAKDKINELLKKEDYTKGVIITNKNNAVSVELHLVLAYDTKISEVVNEVQKRVKYTVEKTLNMDVISVNVHIEGIKVI